MSGTGVICEEGRVLVLIIDPPEQKKALAPSGPWVGAADTVDAHVLVPPSQRRP